MMIYAVVWFDFVHLSLRCTSAEEAIAKAQATHERGSATLGLRAVSLDAADNLVTLWAPVGMPELESAP